MPGSTSLHLGAGNSTAALGPLPFGRALTDLLRCGWRTTGLITRRRIHQPTGNVGLGVCFADGSRATVYRETVIDRTSPLAPAVLVVCFRLRRVSSAWQHGLFRLESELNTILFAGFPGLISKLWFGHDQNGLYRGLYQWDDPELALSYVRVLSWVLDLVSEPGSIRYRVLPGIWREQLLSTPGLADAGASGPGHWWLPVSVDPRW